MLPLWSLIRGHHLSIAFVNMSEEKEARLAAITYLYFDLLLFKIYEICLLLSGMLQAVKPIFVYFNFWYEDLVGSNFRILYSPNFIDAVFSLSQNFNHPYSNYTAYK